MKNHLETPWMLPAKASIQREATLRDAIERMKKLGIHHLVVQKGKDFQGILSAEDCAGIWDPTTEVRHVMRTHLPQIQESFTLKQVVHEMQAYRVSAVPLFDANGKVFGILTGSDILKMIELELLSSLTLREILERGQAILGAPAIQQMALLLSEAGV